MSFALTKWSSTLFGNYSIGGLKASPSFDILTNCKDIITSINKVNYLNHLWYYYAFCYY